MIGTGRIAIATAGLMLGAGFPAVASPGEPPPVPPGCTGGLAPNPSLEDGSPPAGYTFEPASPVPPGTPAAKRPKLDTADGYQQDGGKYALISTPDAMVSTAYDAVKFVPGGVYTLTDWTGTHDGNLNNARNQQSTGLRFYDTSGAQVAENKLPIEHSVDADGKLGRQDFPATTAPPAAAAVKFFAATNYQWAMWDCVYLQLAAYSAKKEVQNPDTGAWGPSATITAGDTAHYRITVTNDGTQPLTGITVSDPWCAALPAAFDLAAGAANQITCDHPNITMADDKHVNTATVAGVKYPGGALDPKTATTTIQVKEPPAIDKIGDFVWIDQNRNGLQDAGEPGKAGVKVTLKDGAGGTVATTTTDGGGKYVFEKLKDGTYQVCFDVPNGYQATIKDAGDDTLDSDAGPDGCTPPTTVGVTKREDLTLDLGLVPPTR